MNKYRNVKTTIDGITFDSKLEADRWCELQWLLRAGAIKDLRRQVPFVLQDGFSKNGERFREIKYVADFVYTDSATGKTVVEDAKGIRNDVFNIKRKLFEKRYPYLSIREVKKR